MDRLEQTMAQIARSQQELSQTVADAAQRLTAPQAPSAPQQTNDEFLSELATDPRGLITRVASQAAQAVASQQLTPALVRTLDLAASQLISEQAQKVDAEVGAGTFDEFFRPQVEKDLAELRKTNPEALANRQVMEALVNRLYGGENFPVLSQRRRQLEQLAQQRGLSHLVPQGGAPRLRSLSGEPELNPEAELFLREVDKATGESTDRKAFAKTMATGHESGPGRHRTSIADWGKAADLTPDQRKMYGIDKQ
jgi:hypothetical protein